MPKPKNVPKGSVLQAGGVVVKGTKIPGLCEAYKIGLNNYCKAAKKGPPGDFNDYVTSALKKTNPELYDSMMAAAEKPIGVLTSAGPQGLEALAENSSKAEGVLDMVSKADGLLDSGMSASAYRFFASIAVRGGLGSSAGSIQRVLCPDGATPAPNPMPVELKRPTELESHPDQLKNYAGASPSGKVGLGNCGSCNLPCQKWNSDCEGAPMK